MLHAYYNIEQFSSLQSSSAKKTNARLNDTRSQNQLQINAKRNDRETRIDRVREKERQSEKKKIDPKEMITFRNKLSYQSSCCYYTFIWRILQIHNKIDGSSHQTVSTHLPVFVVVVDVFFFCTENVKLNLLLGDIVQNV